MADLVPSADGAKARPLNFPREGVYPARKTLDVVVTRICRGGKETKTFTFVFDKHGQVDKKKSHLK